MMPAARRLAFAALGTSSVALALGAQSPGAPAAQAGGARAPQAAEVGRELEPRGVVPLESPRAAMVRIGASSFQMGSDEAAVLSELADCAREAYGHRCTPTLFSNETPQHAVHVSSFWIDRFEVSVAGYERCVAVGRCEPRPTSEATRRFDRGDFPVTRVTWNDAAAYCAARGARLPTEAEFERAARGVLGRRHPWGDLFNTRASNHGRFAWDVTEDADGFVELAPIGSFPDGATPEGIHDLAGNVAEWVLDRYAPTYDVAARSDPRGPGVGGSNLRVVRGGSYAQPRFRVRGAARGFAEPGERRSTIGFRCARGERPGREAAGERSDVVP
jgi:formylglycine-generating enzyme